MILKNGFVFTEDAKFVRADVELAGDRIVKVAPAGERADVLVLDSGLQPRHIFIGGQKTK